MLDFALNRLRLQGKLGVYGRSIGGISACHLAATYPDLICTLIVDRSLCELKSVGQQKLGVDGTTCLFNYFTSRWQCLNDVNFLKADNCYKIVTCDPLDDTIDQFTNVMTGVAHKIAKTDYNDRVWRIFFDSILFLVDYE